MKAPRIHGVDELIRAPMNEGRMLYRARRLAEIEPPYVMLDTDMLIKEDISEGLEDCDVALTWRAKHRIYVEDNKPPIAMPYNGGVVFVNNQEFMKDCLRRMEGMEPKLQDWYGDQIALRDAVNSGRYKVKELKDVKWNFVPDSEGHDLLGVRIYHYKGLRKRFMPNAFKRMFGG